MLYRMRPMRFKSRHMPEISLTPLIDTALVLLVIFMVTTPIMHHGLNIDLPKSQVNESQNQKQEFVIYIDQKENIFLNEKPLSLSELTEELIKNIGSAKNQVVYINGDKVIQYGVLIDVVDKVKSIPGVENVILSTERAV